MDKVLDSGPKLVGDKNTSQFEYKDIVWDSNNRFYDLKELALSILFDGFLSMKNLFKKGNVHTWKKW